MLWETLDPLTKLAISLMKPRNKIHQYCDLYTCGELVWDNDDCIYALMDKTLPEPFGNFLT